MENKISIESLFDELNKEIITQATLVVKTHKWILKSCETFLIELSDNLKYEFLYTYRIMKVKGQEHIFLLNIDKGDSNLGIYLINPEAKNSLIQEIKNIDSMKIEGLKIIRH